MENFDAFRNIQTKIDRDRIWLAVSVADMSVGFVVPTDTRVGLFIAVFMFITGLVFGVLLMLDIIMSTTNYHEWHKAQLSAYRLQQGLPLPKHETENLIAQQPQPETKSEASAPVNVWTTQGNKATRKEYADPPMIEFFNFMFGSMQSNQRIPSEPSFASWGKQGNRWTSTQSNTWLTYTDEQGVTEKMYESESGNSPRRVKQGVTYEMALAKFGLTVPTLSSLSATQNAPSQA